MTDNQNVVSVRFGQAELAMIKGAAVAAGVSVGAFVKSAASSAAAGVRPGGIVYRASNGSVIKVWSNVPGSDQTGRPSPC